MCTIGFRGSGSISCREINGVDCSSYLQSSPVRRSLFPSPFSPRLHIPNPIRLTQTELRRRESLNLSLSLSHLDLARFENLRSAFQFGCESDLRRCLGRCRGRNRRLTGAGIRRLRSGIGIAEEAEEIVVDLRIRILIAGERALFLRDMAKVVHELLGGGEVVLLHQGDTGDKEVGVPQNLLYTSLKAQACQQITKMQLRD
ncbi:hypothetical protein CKAN_01296000 [Cinnamomum micranthum f. kanehirae]|uniref:Uncharacterized protein n=1 Tax=Cinnamomum micranthum f. kanehirae TaxID=337451 RepID=A0A3S3NPV5_9MAGN|nr:hypothetical protein CKAN_01296000 [Cinnamomum micranthum f. kanehirae]